MSIRFYFVELFRFIHIWAAPLGATQIEQLQTS
jgi:hypothetical protein